MFDAQILFTAHKETIWHITCRGCRFYFSYATMEDIDHMTAHNMIANWYCPNCGEKLGKDGRVDECTSLES